MRSGQTYIIVKDRLSVDFKGPRHTVHKQKHGNSPLYIHTNIYAYIYVWQSPIYERRVDCRKKKRETESLWVT